MKLLTKTNRLYALQSAAIFVVGAVLFYIGIRQLITRQADENLRVINAEIRQFVGKNDSLPSFFSTRDFVFEVQTLPVNTPQYQTLRDTFIGNPSESGELEPYRQLAFTLGVKGQLYEVKLNESSLEDEDLIGVAAGSAVVLWAILLVLTFWTNQRLAQTVWSPFNDTLLKINRLQLTETDSLSFAPTTIDEFNNLNRHLKRMTDRLRLDYQTLKEFTDNASHELQTPLALLQNRLDNLLQNSDLPAVAVDDIAASLRVVGRLSRLSKTLLLMTKIDNQQFQKTEKIDLAHLINERLDLLAPIIEKKQLTVTTELSKTDPLSIHPVLAEILVSNLLSNAIRHNILKGQIHIKLTDNQLVVSNTGKSTALDAEQIFKRFKKGVDTEGVGLGLSLVERIGQQYGFGIGYRFEANAHRFSVDFKTAAT